MIERVPPTPAAMAALRRAHPPLVAAQAAVEMAEGKLAEARQTLRTRQAEADRLPADVAAGRARSADLEGATARTRTAALLIPPAEKALAEAQAAVDREIGPAVQVLAATIHDRRAKLRRDLPNARVKELQSFVAAELALYAEAEIIKNIHGHDLLAGQDLGAPLAWPKCLADEIEAFGVTVAGQDKAVADAGGLQAVSTPIGATRA